LLGGYVHAGDESNVTDKSSQATIPSLVLSIRARALGLDSVLESSGSLGLEPARAPTGAGTSRMPPATTEIARGVYVSVTPACLPGVDDLGVRPLSRRSPLPRSR
jgi:hypothetical protein